MKKSNILCVLFVSSFWLLATCAFSQNVFSSEEDLKKQANKLFEEEEFGKAYPLFSQLLSLYPKDAQYNYKFGTCLLFSSSDKGKAIPYIEYAAKRQKQDVDKEVFFYLGKAYHLNYRFQDAIKSYITFKGIASSRQMEKYNVDRQVEMCESGKKLLRSVTELSVLEKKEVPTSDFFRSYNLSEFNAKLVITPEDLKSSIDKKKKDESLMYLSPDRNQIYYSSYGEDGKNGKDIYFVTRTSSGDLSKPIRVSDVINTKYDEDYAFLHPDGNTLYFCSQGHNSMGGYDIFKSEWNSSTQSWGNPVNMDFAINTPDDDILFISDAEDKSAYFSSHRESAEGRITVYKIKLDRKPLDLAIIKGTLTKTTGDRMSKATITVTKILKDEVVGIFNTNAADGSYTLKLPNGGKFMFAIESPGFKKSSELVIIPNQQEIKPMKQEITLVNEDGQDKVIIKNEFDSQVDSADMQLAIEFIKAKASLAVSPEEEKITTVAVEENTPTLKEEDVTNSSLQDGGENTPVTNSDIIEMAYQDAKVAQKEANELLKNSEAARLLSRQKNELSIQKYNEALELMKTAETLTNQEEKIAQSDRAAIIKKESETLSKESIVSLNLSNLMDVQATGKQQQADAELKYAKDLDNAIRAGANENKMNELLARKEDLDKKNEVLDASFPPDLNKEINATQTQASKSMAKYLDAQQDVEDLQTEANRLRSEAEKTKNDGVKQNLTQQAEEMEKEVEIKKKDAETYSATAKQQQAQADSLKNSASLTASVLKQIQGTPETTTASSSTPESTALTSTAVSETGTVTTTQATPPPSETTTTQQAVKSPYVDVFVSQMNEAEKKTNELEKAETLAVVYQLWTDSLDRQIAELNKQLAATQAETYKAQIQTKIYELQSSVDDKRQKAADNRSKVDNLKLQAALAEASTVTPPPNESLGTSSNTVTATSPETTLTSEVVPENITGTKNINAYYENKLQQNSGITNEYEKKVKEQEFYQDWSSALYDESQRLKKEGSAGKAEDAVNESRAKQALAMESADEVTKIKAERPELAASANLTSAETIAPSETKTESSTVPATTTATNPEITTAASTNTVSETSPTSTETTISVPSINTNTTVSTQTTTASSIETSTQPVEPLSTVPPNSLTHKDEYTHFAALKNESDWAKKNADRQFKQAADIQKEADKQFSESQELSDKIAKSNDPNERQNLKNLADILDRSALKNQAKADSIKTIARNSEAESNSKRTESDLYLQSLDKAAYEEVTTATGYTPPTLASNAAPAKTESVTLTVNTTTVAVPDETTTTTETAKETIAINTNTTTATETAKETSAINTNTTTATKTAKDTSAINANATTVTETAKDTSAINTNTTTVTETAKEAGTINTNTTSVTETAKTTLPESTLEPETTAVKTETAPEESPGITPPVKNETIEAKTESTTQPIVNETTAPKTESVAKESFETTPSPKTTSTESTTPPANTSTASAETMKYYDAIFDKLDFAGTSYSPSKPIPIDAPMPEGLVFKVQIGAFRNPIPQDLFKGIKPITAETTPQGLKRYTAGIFQRFETANKAKTQVNGLGYRDAFIVAFFNGKRISMNEALAKARDAGETISSEAISNTGVQPPANTGQTSSAGTSIANTTDVKSVSGLFYTIQIGVFSREVNSTQLYNISPLNSERTANGLIRYTTGRFNDEAKAVQAKNNIAQKGISDAFVIAYRDGKRISLSSAKSMIDSEGNDVLAKDKQEYSIVPSDTTTTENSGKSLTTSGNLGIVFKVQVGAFREQVPISIANKLLANSSKGIKTFRDENGLLVYTVGEFFEYESANSLKSQLVTSGLNDAFVIAFQNGKKITASAALELLKNK